MVVDIVILLWIALIAGIGLSVARVVRSVVQTRAKMSGIETSAPRTAAPPQSAELETLRQRVEILEAKVEERDQAMRKVQDELSFVSRMLEDKTGEPKT